MPLANNTTKPKPPRKHPSSVGARARAHRWKEAPGGLKTPGPGTYDVTPKPAGGLFGRFPEGSGKSDIEWEIYRAKQLPGPARYSPKIPGGPVSGGRFNTSVVKDEIDLEIYRSKDIPGPGQYNMPDESLRLGGGRFNMSKGKTDIEWEIYRAAQLPGAGAYDVPDSFGTGGGVNFATKPIKGNYQTSLPDAVLYKHTTVRASPHTAFRSDPALGKQVVSSQKTEPAFSFGGGKTFDMHEHNIKNRLKHSKRASAKANKRRKAARTKKEEADELFKKFFGYDPKDSTQKGKHRLVSKQKRKPRPQTTPGPGHYVLPPTLGAPLRTRKTGPSFSFPVD